MADQRLATLRIAENRFEMIVAQSLAWSEVFFAWFVDAVSARLGLGLTLTERLVRFDCAARTAVAGYDIAVTALYGESRLGFLIVHATRAGARAAGAAREAAEAMVAANEATAAFTVLVGHEPVIEKTDFDVAIDAAEVVAALADVAAQAEGEAAALAAFQLGVAQEAAEAIGAVLAANPSSARAFFDAYRGFITERTGLIGVTTETGSVAAPGMIVFDVDALPDWGFMPTPRIAHHLREGLASILLEGWGDDIEGLAALMDPALSGTGYHLATSPSRLPGGRAGALVIADVPALDPDRPFEAQQPLAEICLARLLDLRSWFAERRTAARYWAEFCNPTPMRRGKVRGDVRLK